MGGNQTRFPVAVVDDERFDAHVSPSPHPERPERLIAAREGLARALPPSLRIDVPPAPASPQDLRGVHTDAYLEALEDALSRGWGHLDGDTFFSPGSREATWLATGGAIALTRRLLDPARPETLGIGLHRPPGHHATPDGAMGFCLLNHVALAARAALGAGAERVAIVDWDVHHGNGTQAAFEEDERVLFVSMHQWPLYPGTGRASDVGRGPGAGRTANVPLPPGAGIEAYADAFHRVVSPLLSAFTPDLVLVSAGYDGHARDPLAAQELEDDAYGAMAAAVIASARALGHGRVAFLLEGGYDLVALEGSVAATARACVDDAPSLPRDAPRPVDAAAVDETLHHLAAHWPGLAG